jgi:hypothetical protein
MVQGIRHIVAVKVTLILSDKTIQQIHVRSALLAAALSA